MDNPAFKMHFESGVKMGIGIFNLVSLFFIFYFSFRVGVWLRSKILFRFNTSIVCYSKKNMLP